MRSGITGLARGTLVYGIGEVLSRFISFLLLPVFTAYLSPADFGVVSILTTLGVFLTPVFSLGLGAAIAPIYFEGNSRERKDATISTTFALLAASAAFLVVGGLVLSRWLSRVLLSSEIYGDLVRLSISTTALTILVTPFRQYLQFEERAKSYVALSALSIACSGALSVLLVAVLRRGVHGVLEAGFLGQAATLILFAWPALREVRPTARRALGRELLNLSLPLVPAFGFLFILQHGSKYMLQWLRGLEEVGLYTVGLNVGLTLSLVVAAFQGAWIPYFMSFAAKPDEGRVPLGRVLTYYVFGVGSLSLALFAVAKPLLMLMTQPAFHGAWRVVGLSAAAQFFAGVFNVLLPGMYIAKEVRYTGLIQGTAAAVGLLLNLALIPALGVVGAGLALVLSYLMLAVLQHRWNRFRGYLEVAYEWGRVGRFALLYAGLAVAAEWSRDLPLPIEVAFAAFQLLLLPVALYALLTGEERRTVTAYGRRFALRAFAARATEP